jgi:MFS family permease
MKTISTEDSKRPLKTVINGDDSISGYGTIFGGAPAELTSWRRYLIGPLLSVYMFGYMMSYYTITEYTNKTWHDIKFKEANVSVNSSSLSVCVANKSSPEFKLESEATSMAAQYMVYYSLSQGIPAVVSNLILGSYTDALGRKFLLGVGISGTLLRLIFSVIIIYFKFDMLYFIGACFIEGCTGQYATFLQVCLAYAGDITKPGKQRTNGMAYIMFMLGSSLTLASFAAGYLIQNYNFYVPLAAAVVLLTIAFFMMLVLLPESFPPEKRKTGKSLREVVGHSFSFFISKDYGSNRWKYQFLLLAHGFCEFSFLGRIGTETIYQMSTPFCWSAEKVNMQEVLLFNHNFKINTCIQINCKK